MPQCYRLNLGDAILADQTLAELKFALTTLYLNAHKPEAMWAFYRHESAGVHCNLVVYLSAELQSMALLDKAAVCTLPSLTDSCFMVGEQKGSLIG